jgi:CRP-like cAMP-binding protein
MRVVRNGLLAAWFVLIASLLWDPLTPALTRPDNLASPFHLTDTQIVAQDRPLVQTPYAMGNRVFWTMVLPLVPLFLMVFGHEAWRRICPLSQFSQIPHMLGWQRHVKNVNLRTGRIDQALALLPSNSWLRRNHDYFQFGFLTLGLLGRLLFYNSDRLALALVFAFVLCFALIIGLLYGGKTWCNYFCPVAVIQRIYTGPGGILDSKAHIAPTALSQSMCRSPSPGGDRSICVGCTNSCPDVDLEGSYWKGVESPSRRFVYYGFFGLVFAFYAYYYVYSGNWAYYMSGAWTHEADQTATIMAPGFYIDGHAIPVPKLVAAPIFFAICILGSYWSFLGFERLYAWLRARYGKSLSTARRRHQMLTICAFASINLFYLFAGRPNILMLPEWAVRLIDAIIILASSFWLWAALARDADLYRHEQLARSLRDQLARMGFRSEDVLEGRPIESLSADEVYVLAKSLPGFTEARKREAYRSILADALQSGDSKSADSLQTLKNLRLQLGLSDADHNSLLEALGVQDPRLLDPDETRSVEQRIRQNNYRDLVSTVMQKAVAAGVEPRLYFARNDVAESLRPLRSLFGIGEDLHGRIVDEVARDASAATRACERTIDAIREVEINRYSLAADTRPESRLLRRALLQKQKRLVREAANLVAPLEDLQLARRLAQSIYVLVGADAASAIRGSIPGLSKEVREALTEMTADPVICSYFDIVAARRSCDSVLQTLIKDSDQAIAAVALSGIASLDRAQAGRLAGEVAERHPDKSWLTGEILAALEGDAHLPLIDTMAEFLVIDTFAGLDLADFADIARRAERMHLRRGDVICRSGDISDRMFILLAGETRVFAETAGGRRLLRTGRSGAVFGELGVITGRARTATVEVSTEAAVVMAIPGEVIHELLGRDPQAARSILAVVSEYLFDTVEKAETEPEVSTVAGFHPA